MSEEKKYVDLEGLEYFLEKFKYALAHNETMETSNEVEEDTSVKD